VSAPPPDWIGRIPGLAELAPAERAVLAQASRVVAMPAGARLFAPGDRADGLPLLLDGVAAVRQTAENGREILLYRIEAGQSCVLTTACLLGGDAYPAEAVAETAVSVAMLSRSGFDQLTADSAAFRRFVFAAHAARLAALFGVVEEVLFGRLDRRLARLLVDRADGGALRMTHQAIAAELGSAREVVTRQLQSFQRQGWVSLSRGAIALRDPAALGAFAAAP